MPPPPQFGKVGAGGLAPPPSFLDPNREKRQQRSSDPFAAQPESGRGPQEVRLVVDERPVEDAEVGRKKSWRNVLLVAIGSLLGLGVGAGVASVNAENKIYNATVRDGKSIYESIGKAQETVEEADRMLADLIKAAKVGPGSKPSVGYEEITKLRALEHPFAAAEFSQKMYARFKPQTVYELFTYFNHVNLLWQEFERLANRSLSPRRQAALDQAAEAADELVNSQTGCVPTIANDAFRCSLVYVSLPPEGAKPGIVLVARSKTGRTSEKQVFFGQDLSNKPEQFVVLTDTRASQDVLGTRASEFREYRATLGRIKETMVETMKLQGQLLTSVGEIAQLPERFTL